MRKRIMIKGEIETGIAPKYIRYFENFKKEVDPDYPRDMRRIDDYLYEIWYSHLDYNLAKDYFAKYMDYTPPVGACSSVRKGNLYGRNLDWLFDNGVEFVVHTAQSGSRKASIGVAGLMKELDKEFVETGLYSEAYKILPFQMLDGINEAGVACNVNVVPKDKGTNIGYAAIEEKERLSGSMLVRYILDNFSTAKEAVEYIRDYVTVVQSESLHKQDFEEHYMICDPLESYLIEFIENQTVIINMSEEADSPLAGKPYMTNFYLSDIQLNEDGSVYTPYTQDEDHDAIKTNLITPNGSGLERYNLINAHYEGVDETAETMTDLMLLLRFSNAYAPRSEEYTDDKRWFTEFVSAPSGVNVATPYTDERLNRIVDSEIAKYEGAHAEGEPGRNPESEFYGTWQTSHTSVYDFAKSTLIVLTQERDEEYEFKLTKFSGAEYNMSKEGETEDFDSVYHLTKDGDEIGIPINIPKGISTKISLGKEMIAQASVGGIPAGKVYSEKDTLATILEDLLRIGPAPTGKKIYRGVFPYIPTDVSLMDAEDVDPVELVHSGLVWKDIELNNEYAFLAIDKSLGIQCYEIIQSGFALEFNTVDLGDQIMYYPVDPGTATGVRLTYHFE